LEVVSLPGLVALYAHGIGNLGLDLSQSRLNKCSLLIYLPNCFVQERAKKLLPDEPFKHNTGLVRRVLDESEEQWRCAIGIFF